MLVLTRKQQEKIRIGDGITITVLKMKGKSVRLGIEAPMTVPVVRGELMFQESSPTTAEVTIDVTDVPELSHAASAALPLQDRQPNWPDHGDVAMHRIPRAEADKLRRPLRAMLDSRIAANR